MPYQPLGVCILKPLILKTLTLMSAIVFTAACTANAQDLNQEEIEQIVHNYILENPEIIREAIFLLQERAEAEKAAQEAQALSDMTDLLENNELDPVGGNLDGTITIVEFFDYNCGYCKRVSPVLEELVEENPNLRVVFKELPILAESSVTAARIALAVNMVAPEKYEALHHDLLSLSKIGSDNDIWKVVKKLDIDRDAVEAKLSSPEIELHLQQSSQLAQTLNITGTPAFVVGDIILRGAYPKEQIQRAIDTQS